MFYRSQTALYQLRKALTKPKVSQEELARQAGVSRQWLHVLETGKRGRVSYTTAKNLLAALNTERQARGLEALDIDDLGLTIA